MKIIHFSLLGTLILAAVFTTSSSCKRNKYCKKKAGTCRSVLEAKDFFLFKEGSWWVYEEETTHERDSQYVYESHNTSDYDFDTRIHSTLENFDYHFWPVYAEDAKRECNESEPVSSKCIHIYRNKGKIGNYIGQGICFFINYNLNDWTYGDNYLYPTEKLIFISINYNLQFSFEHFENVIIVSEEKTLIEKNQPTKHFYVKNIGLIRKELLDSNQVWNLVSYHIEQ